MIELEVKNLTKEYNGYKALNGLDFALETGRIYGFLGPNGAGKSTTMNILTGCLSRTSGEVLVEGHDIFEEQAEAKKHIGYLPEIPPLYMEMTPREYLHFVCEIKHIPSGEMKASIDDVMERTKISHVADRIIRQLSKGYRQRVGIAQALLGYPEIIILDEPMVGLDPAQIIEIRELIRSLKKEHTVFISSHILSEISEICDEVLIIAQGTLVARDTPDNLSRMISEGSSKLMLTVKGTRAAVEKALTGIDGISRVTFAGADDSGTETETHAEAGAEKADADSAEASAGKTEISDVTEVICEAEMTCDCKDEIFYALAQQKLPIHEMKEEKLSLEQIFLEYTGKHDSDSDDRDMNDK